MRMVVVPICLLKKLSCRYPSVLNLQLPHTHPVGKLLQIGFLQVMMVLDKWLTHFYYIKKTGTQSQEITL